MRWVRVALVGLALAGLGVGVGLIVAWATQPRISAEREAVRVDLGPAAFAIPPAYFRGTSAPRPGPRERVDLVLALPDFAAGGAEAEGLRLFVALLREDGVVDPARRTGELYGRFLEPDIWSNPGGLLLRRFRADSPYADEELFLSPPEGREFAARCRKPAQGGRGAASEAFVGKESCLWRFRASGVDVQVRFSPDLLPQWESFAGPLKEIVAGWRR